MADVQRQTGKPPSGQWRLPSQADSELETYLDLASGVDRRAVLYGLLKREVGYRLSLGEAVVREDYEAQLEGDDDLLDALFPDKASAHSLLKR